MVDPVLTGGVPESLPAGDLCPGPRLHSRPRPQDPGLGSPLSAPRNPGFISVVCRGWKSGGALGFCRQALLSRRQWKCDADPEDKGRTKAWPPLRREPGRSRGDLRGGEAFPHSRGCRGTLRGAAHPGRGGAASQSARKDSLQPVPEHWTSMGEEGSLDLTL